MIKILFICHGNICRSPMAEFVMRDLIRKCGYGDKILTASAATSTEEIGNPVHRGTRDKLKQYGISTAGKTAVQLRKSDYEKYDFFIGMDGRNVTNMRRILGKDPEGKIFKLMEFSGKDKDIADPWYTGNFDETYEDVRQGCESLLKKIIEEYNLKNI